MHEAFLVHIIDCVNYLDDYCLHCTCTCMWELHIVAMIDFFSFNQMLLTG